MNTDHRNLGLVGTTDGVPFFDDQRRGNYVCAHQHNPKYVNISCDVCKHYPMRRHIMSQCLHNMQCVGAWPFILRCANLPDTLSMHMSNCHLHMLSANEYWELDKSAGVLRRRIHAPKSLKPHLIVIVDDLLHAYSTGLKSRHILPNVSTSFFHSQHYYTICQHYNKLVDISCNVLTNISSTFVRDQGGGLLCAPTLPWLQVHVQGDITLLDWRLPGTGGCLGHAQQDVPLVQTQVESCP